MAKWPTNTRADDWTSQVRHSGREAPRQVVAHHDGRSRAERRLDLAAPARSKEETNQNSLRESRPGSHRTQRVCRAGDTRRAHSRQVTSLRARRELTYATASSTGQTPRRGRKAAARVRRARGQGSRLPAVRLATCAPGVGRRTMSGLPSSDAGAGPTAEVVRCLLPVPVHQDVRSEFERMTSRSSSS
jgi:hypothetical protein